MKQTRLQNAGHIRNFVFGVEDSLVSTVGLLTGIAVGGVPRAQIILTGMVLLFVEAFSMAIGSLLSEQSAEEYLSRKEVSIRASATDSAIMFASYFLAGLITLSPYVLLESQSALPISVSLSLAALLVLGFGSAKIFGINMLKSGIRTFVMGGFAILIGILVSHFLTRQ